MTERDQSISPNSQDAALRFCEENDLHTTPSATAFRAGVVHGIAQESARRDALPYRDCCNRAVRQEAERQERAWSRDYAALRDERAALRESLIQARAEAAEWRAVAVYMETSQGAALYLTADERRLPWESGNK